VHSRSRAPLLLSLWQASPTCQPLSRARSLSLADRPHRSAASSSSRTTHRRPLIAVPSPSPRRTGKFGTAPSPPLDRVLASTAPPPPPRREVSSSPLCGINAGTVHLTGARRAPPLPSPRAPIKGRPGAPPSPHRPQPPPFSPRQAQFREAPPYSSPPVSSPPLLPPSLLVQRTIESAYQLPLTAANSAHHFFAPIPRPKLTDGDPRRGALPPPRGQPPPGPF
jgi:hypothetical protein